MRRPVACLTVLFVLIPTSSAFVMGEEAAEQPRKVAKSDQEWARLLTPDQFQVCRLKATEPAFSGRYAHSRGKGTYACVCCGSMLFSSRTKFDSGTGWPSFWSPIGADTLETDLDTRTAELRVEVQCQVCGAHLGHVFNDGPPPTGLRYCINSVALRFVPGTTPKPVSKGTTRRPEPKAKPKAKDRGTDSAGSGS